MLEFRFALRILISLFRGIKGPLLKYNLYSYRRLFEKYYTCAFEQSTQVSKLRVVSIVWVFFYSRCSDVVAIIISVLFILKHLRQFVQSD